MRIITIEEHYADQRIIDATAKYGDPSYMTALPDKVRGAYNHMRFTGEKLTDVDTVRFDFMLEQKVDVQVLSYTNPVPDTVPSEEAVKICREANDILADMVKKTPRPLRRLCHAPDGRFHRGSEGTGALRERI